MPKANPTTRERLTEQFYEWERNGRGWHIWPEPVELEPPFRQFVGHILRHQSVVDDGRIETPLSTLANGFLRLIGCHNPSTGETTEDDEAIEPELARSPAHPIEFQTLLPADLDLPREAFEQFLLSLSLARHPIAFELLGQPSRIGLQFAVHPEDRALAQQQLDAFFPDASFLAQENVLNDAWQETETAVVEFGLGREFMLRLSSGKLDPFVGIIGALAGLQEGELGLVQVLFQRTRRPWPESILRAVTDNTGEPFFANAPELTDEAREKASRPLFAVVVRIATQGESFDRCWEIVRHLAGAFHVFANPLGNELIPLRNDEYPFDLHVADVLQRQTRRSGMLLNLDELAGFVHLPGAAVRSAKLQRDTRSTNAAPSHLTQGILLGCNLHLGRKTEVRLGPEERVRHTHVIGASGTGKSTLLLNMIRQDIEDGAGVGVLDPHGDLVEDILGIIPEHRIGDVVLVDPADVDFPVGFNILSAHSDLERTLLASDLVSVFQRLSTSWGDQMGSVLQNAILAFLESKEGGTLADLRRFLVDPAYRAAFLQSVTDPDIVFYWTKTFPQLTGNRSIGPVLTRLETFLSPKSIRYMVSQQENRLDFAEILDSGKIFLAKLSQGQIGRENAFLLGSLLVAKFQQTAMSRQRMAHSARRDFWLYIDEFHNFITPSMAEILTGARKYRTGLTLAHQELRQLQRDSEVAGAVLSNSYTRIVFRVGDEDARKLADGFGHFEAGDLQNLGVGEAVCRVERSDHDFNLAVPPFERPVPARPNETRERVITASREKYAVPRAEVEAALFAKVRTESRHEKPKQSSEIKGDYVHAPSAQPPEQPKEPAPEPADRELQAAIQERIRQAAEAIGYEAKLEHVILDGAGRTDITLIRGPLSVACEITVTTTIEHEAANITKCLRGGFGHVAVICASKQKLEKIKELVAQSISPAELAKVGFYVPNEFVEQLYVWTEEVPDVPKGKSPPKQSIRFEKKGIGEEERKRKESAMLKSISAAMKRSRGEN